MDNRTKEIIKMYIIEAKNKINNSYNDSRPWQSIKQKVYGWGEGDYDLELISRPGSPCKGYIIINYGTCTIKAFNCSDKCIATYKKTGFERLNKNE